MCDSGESKVKALKTEIECLENKMKDGPATNHALAKHLKKTTMYRLKHLKAQLQIAEEASKTSEHVDFSEEASKTSEPDDFDFLDAVKKAGGTATNIGNNQMFLQFGGSAS